MCDIEDQSFTDKIFHQNNNEFEIDTYEKGKIK